MISESRIELAGQYGEPSAGGGLGDLQTLIQRCLDQFCRQEYCPTVAKFSIVLRVSGQLVDYGSDGPNRLHRNRKKSYITADFCIPETKWRGKSRSELARLLAGGVRETLRMEVARLLRDKEQVHEELLWRDFDRAVEEFSRGMNAA